MKDETLGEPKREMEYNLFKLARKTFRPMTVEGSGDMTPPVSPVETGPPDEIYVCFMKDWNSWHIHNWTTKATDNYHKFVLAGNKLLDTIDAHDSEKEPLSSNHPDVHAFSSLLDKRINHMYDYDVLVDKYDEKCYEIVKLKRILKVFLNDDAKTSKISCMLLGIQQ